VSLSDLKNLTARDGAKYLWLLVSLGVAYFVAAWLGLRLAYLHPSATPVWAPTGIALAAILVWGPRVWPAIFVAAFFVNLLTAGNFATSVAIALGNTLEGILGAHLTRRFAPTERFERARKVFVFVLLAGGLSTMVSATIGVASLAIAGYAPLSQVGPIWLTWWMGDASGALIIAPLLLLWARDHNVSWSPATQVEAFGLTISLLLMGQLVFSGVAPGVGPEIPLEFLSVPVLLWAALRFTPREAATATLVLAFIAVRGTLLGYGPFAQFGTTNASLLLVQSFLVVSAATTLILAAVVAERRRDAAQLQLLSESDGLTGLANFRRLNDVIDREIQRSDRTERPFTLLLMDLNELKLINDRYGHVTGNRALIRVAEAMRGTCRAVDTPARFGGDEFAIVLPETDFSEAWAVADRIHERAAQAGEEPALALSCGVAEFPRDGSERDALFEHADRTLYAMKRAAHGDDIREAVAMTIHQPNDR
jgi:diguanylate cyclase (GGDEF)-like protein